jgi:hypothetical protein
MVLPGGLNQLHLFQNQLAISDQLLQLRLFGGHLFSDSIADLLLGPNQFLLDLVPLRRIRRVASAAHTSELGRTHITDHARTAEHFGEGSQLALRILQHPTDLLWAAQRLGADVNTIYENHLRGADHLAGRGPRIVFGDGLITLVK